MKLDKSEFPVDSDKSCPFCASRDILCEESSIKYCFHGERWVCWCRNCGAIGPNDLGWSGAIEMWNMRRLHDKLAQKLLETIKDLEELFERNIKND